MRVCVCVCVCVRSTRHKNLNAKQQQKKTNNNKTNRQQGRAAAGAAAHPRHRQAPRAVQGSPHRRALGPGHVPGRNVPQLGRLGRVERHVPRRRAALCQGRRRRQGRVRDAHGRQRRPLQQPRPQAQRERQLCHRARRLQPLRPGAFFCVFFVFCFLPPLFGPHP